MLTSTLDAMALTLDVPKHEPVFQHAFDEAPAMKAEKRKATEPAEAEGEESKKRSTAKVEENAVVERRIAETGKRKKSKGRRRKQTTM